MTTRIMRVVFALLAVTGLCFAPTWAQAQTTRYKFKVLHTFRGGLVDGALPTGALMRDSAGNLYGAATYGGPSGNVCPNGCGGIFRLDPAGNETILYSFTGFPDGAYPAGPLAKDGAGNLYGTTRQGGDANCSCGTVFKLSVSGQFSVLHTFSAAWDPQQSYIVNQYQGPFAGLVADAAGNLYGVGFDDGTLPNASVVNGFIFKIDTKGSYSVLRTFTGWDGSWFYDLVAPPLTVDARGNLYGTMAAGGLTTQGTVFELEASGKFNLLYSFVNNPAFDRNGSVSNREGCSPLGAPLIDESTGTLYGTTQQCGGAANNGNIFKLEKSGAYSIIHAFPAAPISSSGGSGRGPYGGLTAGAANDFYGTSLLGAYGYGDVFMVDAYGKLISIYSFKGQADGTFPYAPVIRDSKGNLYGTTGLGGEWGQGVVFELSPE